MARKYNELLEEMLDLAGVSLYEADDDEEVSNKIDGSDREDDDSDASNKIEDDEDEDEDEDDADEELEDKWSVRINTGSKMEIEFLNTFVYVWYRNKRSKKIEMPVVLRKNKDQLSKFMNEVLSHVEKVS